MTGLPSRDSIEPCLQNSPLEYGDLLVHYLEQLNIEYVFGVPGGAIEPLYNALARSTRRCGPRAIVARSESGAAYMADGYARETGKMGVCCATTGPGATNLITAVAAAYTNEIPMLVITAQTAISHFGRGALQESSCTGVDTLGMFEYCTRYNSLVSHVDQFEHKLAAAILTAQRAPKGPSHLSIPLDLLRSVSAVQQPTFNLSKHIHQSSQMDSTGLQLLRYEISRARRIAIVVGGGCAEVAGNILELALLLDAPIVTTPHGKGFVSAYHPQFRGVFGFAGHGSAHKVLQDDKLDLVLAVGTMLGEWATDGWCQKSILNEKLIHIDNSSHHFNLSPMARLHVSGNLTTIFEKLLEVLYAIDYKDRLSAEQERRTTQDSAPNNNTGNILRTMPKRRLDPGRRLTLDDEEKYFSNAYPLKPQRLMHELSRIFPFATRFLSDAGNSTAWAIHYLHPFDRRVLGPRNYHGGLFRACMEFAPMGWAIGGAIGTALGCPNTPVVCITGDGSWLMNGQEITVAISERLPVIYIILNDGALGMVKHGQQIGGAEPIGFELPRIDYAAMARAMRVQAFTIRTVEDLKLLDIVSLCHRDGPTLLDVYIDVDEVPPIKSRVKVLNNRDSGLSETTNKLK